MLHFPEYYKEVRMTEFTSSLLTAVIRNMPACLKYWQRRNSDEKEAAADRKQMSGFIRTWTDVDRLKLLHVLLDASVIIQRLQKRLQFTFANLDDVVAVKTWAVVSLKSMLDRPVIGGQEEDFLSSLQSVQQEVSILYFFSDSHNFILIRSCFLFVQLLPVVRSAIQHRWMHSFPVQLNFSILYSTDVV
jgi:hypothetical protein